MNKTAIKNFAMEARKKLISDIKYKAGLLGITEKGIANALKQSNSEVEYYDIGTKEPYVIQGKQVYQRRSLATAIRTKAEAGDYKTAYNSIIEEVAYTWFNRLIAVRFMEVNEYLPCKIRVLSSDEGVPEPEIVQRPFESAMEFTAEEEQLVQEMALANEGEKLFRMLFIKECNELSDILPQLFEKQDDYTELLLNISYNDTEGVVYHLVHDIPEDDFNVEKGGQVEIIGWMYQYYNTEPKNETFALLKKNVKITKERIPSATQLFTPDWIVRYMVENSLGRLWVDGHPNDSLKSDWKYYLEEAEQEETVKAELAKIREEYAQLNPEDIKLIDPCMGSGHILVYAFDVLMQIYLSVGYTQKEAVISILENNLYGLDIDERAFQLSYFAVMMKARQYYKLVLKKKVKVNLYAIEESNELKDKMHQLVYFGASMDELTRNVALTQIKGLIDEMHDAKEYGSLLTVSDYDWDLLEEFVNDFDVSGEMDLFATYGIENTLCRLNNIINVGRILSQTYWISITNPPYLTLSNGDNRINTFAKKQFPDSKSDMFAMFIERCKLFTSNIGYLAMITQHSWMFLSSFEKLRKKILADTIMNMLHLGARAFDEIGGEVVQTVSFVANKRYIYQYIGVYCRLVDVIGQNKKEMLFLSGNERYTAKQDSFTKITGYPIAYWVSPNILETFSKGIPTQEISKGKSGQNTGDNTRFLRLWFEVNNNKIGWHIPNDYNGEGYKWIRYNKGGNFRRWYGNLEYIVNWEHDGKDIKDYAVIRNNGKHWSRYIQNLDCLYKEGITWSIVTASTFSMRYLPPGFICDYAGCAIFPEHRINSYMLALFNTKYANLILNIVNPTINFQPGNIGSVPYLFSDIFVDKIEAIVDTNKHICKNDWDSFETSWDFKTHPLILYKTTGRMFRTDDNGDFVEPVSYTLEATFRTWEWHAESYFDSLKQNEEELNRIFIDIYGLQDELTPEVEDKDVTVRLADKERDIKSLLSYAVGCMLGRYSLDVEGLAYAGGDWQEAWNTKYKTYIPDDDNVIPITDEDYFEDDIVGYLCQWLKVVYGEETLEQNLKFIADALGTAGDTPRKRIRNYFLKDFYKDHCKIYQKRPIYWLYDSGKQNGFKALVYMHRYDADTTGNIRVEYLSRMQNTYEAEIARMQDVIETGTPKEAGQAAKRQEKLKKQLKECRDYDAMIGHIALSRIDIDLDDGVKVNYEKVQTSKQGEFLPILADNKDLIKK